MIKTDKATVVEEIAALLSKRDLDQANAVAHRDYPWSSAKVPKRQMTKKRALSVFVRDGFIDRYSGSRLIFPGALLLLSVEMPEAFPSHKNWRVSDSHEIYWELWPVVDHLIPISKGGKDEEDNFATTSTVHNSAKGHWTLEQLGWQLKPPGSMVMWDGMMGWFQSYISEKPELLKNQTISGWKKAASAFSTEA